MDKLYQEGGLADDGARVEPVTGNEVPPGSMDQEVRDDIDAKLSEGEYVIPADVVRFLGLGQIERMVTKAKKGLEEMDANGRIGGEPVDSDGVPLDDEELSPEEMQMLAEALGQAPTGMAMGGMATSPYAQQKEMYEAPASIFKSSRVGMQEGGLVAQPEGSVTQASFDSSPFQFGNASGSSGGVEIVEYINPETGNTRYVSLMNGKVMGVIPEGFVRATPENRELAQKNMSNDLTGESDLESTEGMFPVDNEERSDGTTEQGETPEKDYSEMLNDPISYGINSLEKGKVTTGLEKNAGKLGAAVAGPVGAAVGSALGAISELSSLAEARASLGLAKEQGLDTTELEADIKAYEESMSKAAKMGDKLGLASGDGVSERARSQGVSTTTTPVTKTSSGEDSQSEQKVDDSNIGNWGGDRDGDGIPNALDFNDGVGWADKSKPSKTEETEETAGMSKGGLVAKPSGYKSKVTKKKNKQRRGLGSK